MTNTFDCSFTDISCECNLSLNKGDNKTYSISFNAAGNITINSTNTRVVKITTGSSLQVSSGMNNVLSVNAIDPGTADIEIKFVPTDSSTYTQKTFKVHVTVN